MVASIYPVLVAENLKKCYAPPSAPAVDKLSLNIRQGEVFGLLGPNGAGKTTTLSILSTVLQPDNGTVSICGIDALAQPRQVRRFIGLVPQEIALYDELTARENLAFLGRLYGLKGSALRSGINNALHIVGLEKSAYERISVFSGGMKRRANLAAGMVHSPKVLFLDEPTVGIDAQSRQLIMDKLKAVKQTGVAIMYTTHYMEEAEELCDRVAIMDKGRVLVEGPPSELIAQQPSCRNLGDVFIGLTGKELRD